jgi:hypothetical protein
MSEEQKLEAALKQTEELPDEFFGEEVVEIPEGTLEMKEVPAEQQKGMSLEDSTSMLFGLYYPKFCQGVDMCSNKSLRRLIKALVGVPLVDEVPNLKIPLEKTAFAIGENLLQAKMTMMIHVLYNQSEDIKMQLETNKKEKENGEVQS